MQTAISSNFKNKDNSYELKYRNSSKLGRKEK